MHTAPGPFTPPKPSPEAPRHRALPARHWRARGPFRTLYLSCFSRPRADRQLYRHIRQGRVTRIVELGMGSITRAQRIVEVALRGAGAERVHYTIIDRFDDRAEDAPPRSLLDVYRQLRPSGARLRLVPGPAYRGLARVANELLGTDLLLIAADLDEQALAPAWFYVPRMLHADSLVLRETRGEDGTPSYRPVSRAEIAGLARPAERRRAA